MNWNRPIHLAPAMALLFFAMTPSHSKGAVTYVEAEVLNSRRSMTSGEFEIDVKGSLGSSKFHIWVDSAGRIRQEQQTGDRTRVSCFNEKEAFHYSYLPGSLGSMDRRLRPLVEVSPAADTRRDRSPYLMADPRSLMFVPHPFMISAGDGLDRRVGSSNRSNISTRPSSWNGLDAVTVMFDAIDTGSSYEYDTVPSRGFNIVAWRVGGHRKLHEALVDVSTTQSCTLQEYNGLWFPKDVETRVNTGRSNATEKVHVRIISINQAIDPSVFTIEGSHLPSNIVVMRRRIPTPAAPATEPSSTSKTVHDINTGRYDMIWDGKAVRPLTKHDIVAIAVSGNRPARPRVSRSAWAAGCLLLSMISIILYQAVRHLRAKHQ